MMAEAVRLSFRSNYFSTSSLPGGRAEGKENTRTGPPCVAPSRGVDGDETKRNFWIPGTTFGHHKPFLGRYVLRAAPGKGSRLQQSNSARPGQGWPEISDQLGWLGSQGRVRKGNLPQQVALLDSEVFFSPPSVLGRLPLCRSRPRTDALLARRDVQGQGRLPAGCGLPAFFRSAIPNNLPIR